MNDTIFIQLSSTEKVLVIINSPGQLPGTVVSTNSGICTLQFSSTSGSTGGGTISIHDIVVSAGTFKKVGVVSSKIPTS